MSWRNPLPYALRCTAVSESFKDMPAQVTGVPLAPHPGAFGVVRKHHVHEGVDLYVPEGTSVCAVEAGVVVAVVPFTGPAAGLPHWLDTSAVMVEGASGVVLYGEISACVPVGARVGAGDLLGRVVRVLRHDKGRPTSMLHIELRASGVTRDIEWLDSTRRPDGLLDPTPYLMACANGAAE